MLSQIPLASMLLLLLLQLRYLSSRRNIQKEASTNKKSYKEESKGEGQKSEVELLLLPLQSRCISRRSIQASTNKESRDRVSTNEESIDKERTNEESTNDRSNNKESDIGGDIIRHLA